MILVEKVYQKVPHANYVENITLWLKCTVLGQSKNNLVNINYKIQKKKSRKKYIRKRSPDYILELFDFQY